jgi:hypothetical protein
MNYKELNVYQRAYKAAIDLHLMLNANRKIDGYGEESLRRRSREILSHLAESVNQQDMTKTKNYFKFKTINELNMMLVELAFNHNNGAISDTDYSHLASEYGLVIDELGGKVNKRAKPMHPSLIKHLPNKK